MSLPPVFAASALYDNLLQAALRQFFSRATFETEPIPSLSSDGRLAIEPTSDPSVLTDPLVRIAPRAARAGAAAVHRARSAAGARDRRGAGDTLPRDLRSASRCSSAASCFAARSRIATSARSSTRRVRRDRRSRAPISSRRRSRCCGSRRFRATRTAPISSGVLMLDGDDDPDRAAPRHAGPSVPLFAGAHGDQELLPPERRDGNGLPGQPRRRRSRHRRGRAYARAGDAGRAVRDALPAARARDRRQRAISASS